MTCLYECVNRICTAYETVETMKAQNTLALNLQKTLGAIGAMSTLLILAGVVIGGLIWLVKKLDI